MFKASAVFLILHCYVFIENRRRVWLVVRNAKLAKVVVYARFVLVVCVVSLELLFGMICLALSVIRAWIAKSARIAMELGM